MVLDIVTPLEEEPEIPYELTDLCTIAQELLRDIVNVENRRVDIHNCPD